MFIVENIIGSLFFGTLAALVLTGVIFAACMLTCKRSVQSTEALLIFGGLFIINTAICSMIVGAFYVKGYVEEVGDFVSTLTDTTTDMTLSVADFNELKDQVADEYTSIKPVLDVIDADQLVRHIKVGEPIGNYFVDEINDTIDEYINNCLLWMLGISVIAVAAITVITKNYAPSSRTRSARSPIVQKRMRVNTRRR